MKGAHYLGVATDHVIESFRNDLWPGYKTGEGIDPVLKKQFHPLEDGLKAMGVVVWPMTDLEADDALASAAKIAAADRKVKKVCIWTPDKDLAQCVRKDRVVQIDRKGNIIRNEEDVLKKFGVPPRLIPDYLALVGDSADGYPGIPGIGKVSAVRMLNTYGRIESFPKPVLGAKQEEALLFKKLATLRSDAPLFKNVSVLQWKGPTSAFSRFIKTIDEPRLLERANEVWKKVESL